VGGAFDPSSGRWIVSGKEKMLTPHRTTLRKEYFVGRSGGGDKEF